MRQLNARQRGQPENNNKTHDQVRGREVVDFMRLCVCKCRCVFCLCMISLVGDKSLRAAQKS